ncbi:MAG: VWA domain-containing protein [Rickettsiales bacterium]|nr:VWA domain-containing protein [Rickettsiales bacterium]
MKRPVLKSLLGGVAALAFSASAYASNNMLIILDASNSMWGQVDNVAKIETARGVLGDVLKDLPKETKVGLMAYGHGDKESCKDVEMLVPIQVADISGITQKINSIKPKGKTPIAYSMTQAGSELSKFEGDNNAVVLISDGIETCDGDPCAVAQSLAEQSVGTKVHAVGFDVDEAARKQLECIAEKGGGKYYNADNSQNLKIAMAEVKKAAVEEKKPEPAPAPMGAYFEDEFAGSQLADHWEVVNPNAEAYIVENDRLSIIAGGARNIIHEDVELPNMLKLKKALPSGDFTATMRVVFDTQTVRERVALGIMKDHGNMLYGMTGSTGKCCYHAMLPSWAIKVADGKATSFKGEQLSPNLGRGGKANVKWLDENVDAIELRLEKKGRDYTVSVKPEGKINGGKPAQWQVLQSLSSLKMPGDRLFIAVSQDKEQSAAYYIPGGETLIDIDWVKIEAAQ